MKRRGSLLLIVIIIIAALVTTNILGLSNIKKALIEEAEKESSEYLSHESYKLLYTSVDYKDTVTYVIGHKTPDTDTVTSAMAMAYLLNQLGIEAEARVAGEINAETTAALNYFGMQAPEILESGDGKQLWLVDHSESTQAVDGIEGARIVGIVDHHGIGNLSNEELIVIRSGSFGSTTAEIYTMFKECGVEITKDIARVMLTGLLSDVSFFKHDDNALNREVYNALLEIAEVDDIDKLIELMKEGKINYGGKTDSEIFYVDYKDYEENGVTYGIGNIKVATADKVEAMAARMDAVAKSEIEARDIDYLFYYIYDFDYEKGYLGCVGKNQTEANELLKAAFGDTYEVKEGYLITAPSVSRKTVLVPKINEAINK